MTRNPYEILGVEIDATPEEIKKAYKDKARKCHPDIAKDDGEAFKELSWAYELLSDVNSRAHYDQFEQDPDSNEAERTRSIMNSLCKIFDDISIKLSADQLEKYDLIGIMTKAIQKKISDIENVMKNLNKTKDRFGKLQQVIEERLEHKKKDKPNLFLETLKKRISVIDNDIKSQEFMLDIAQGMLETVQEYDFKFDEQDPNAQQIGSHQRQVNAFGNWLSLGGLGG